MKNQKQKMYLAPAIKVVAFKVELGLTVSNGEPTPVSGQAEQMNRKGWDVDWNTTE